MELTMCKDHWHPNQIIDLFNFVSTALAEAVIEDSRKVRRLTIK